MIGAGIRRTLLRGRGREVTRPAGECEGRAVDRSAKLELPFDRRDQERRELGSAVDAKTRDLVAHARVLEAPEHGFRILLARMTRNLGEGRNRLLVEKPVDETAHRRHSHGLVDVEDPGK